MILLLGSAYAGKRDAAKALYSVDDFCDGRTAGLDEVLSARAVVNFHALLRRLMQEGQDPREFTAKLIEQNPGCIVITDETGSGIIPLERGERLWREECGICTRMLAEVSPTVIRVVCGLPQFLKRTPVPVYLLRHAATPGNLERRYIGKTDEPLSPEGITSLRRLPAFHVKHLFASPLTRCLQTAEHLLPEMSPTVCTELCECDFGDFEGKNDTDLSGNPAYQAWIDSGGTAPFPGGEDVRDFKNRCANGFAARMQGLTEPTAFVVHGGTIMAICERFCGGNYYDYQIPCASGFSAEWDGACLRKLVRL